MNPAMILIDHWILDNINNGKYKITKVLPTYSGKNYYYNDFHNLTISLSAKFAHKDYDSYRMLVNECITNEYCNIDEQGKKTRTRILKSS